MTWLRNSLHLRWAIAQTVAAAVVMVVAGAILFQVIQSFLIARDHDILRQQALWIGASPRDGGSSGLQDRLNTLQSMYPGIRVSLQTVAGRDSTEIDQPQTAPVFAITQQSQPFDAIDLEVTTQGHAVLQVRLMASALPRQEALHSLARILILAVCMGILLSAVLSIVSMGWSNRRLRHLSQQAHAAGQSGHISLAGVDAELLELVEAFNSVLTQREAAYRQSESFSADVAHELRSPLATMIGGAQLALSRPRSSEELRDALASNLEECERLKKLINDMLFLARADRGERAQSLERADLSILADDMISYCGALLDDAGLQAVRIGCASAVCNEALIKRAMANLLSNAIRHAQGEHNVELHLEALPGKVRFWVFNAGPAIADDVASRMFDRFFRANASRSDHTVHHGLGLSIVHAIARMHGGTVFVHIQDTGNAIGIEIPSALASRQVRVREAVHEALR